MIQLSFTSFTMQPIFWLFCTVIDNFGDIGVSWRLAKQLQQRLNAKVHLWLDDLNALATIVPNYQQHNIHIHPWQESQAIDHHTLAIPTAIIETFGCRLPENLSSFIKQHQIAWLNWEYLSAEDWAVHTHTMPSLQNNGCAKYFWQMGFLPQTGGLLRESDYNQQQCQANQTQSSTLNLYLFGYQSPIWAEWFRCWQNLGIAMNIHLSGSQIIQSLKDKQIIPETAFSGSPQYQLGCLKLIQQPFVPQDNFDQLLWQADILLIRGEDSFVRAQYSGKPFFWHIYPQDEQAHFDKLNAFWQLTPLYQQPNSINTAFHALSTELNGGEVLPETQRTKHWQTLLNHLTKWQQLSQSWQQYLFQQTDTVTRLMHWLKDKNYL